MDDDNGRSIKSVEHSITIIEHLRERGPIGVSDLAAQLEMPKSTAYVHLQTLQKHGYAVQTDGAYDLGLQFLETGSIARRRHAIYRAAREEVNQLAADVEEAAHLGIEQNGKRVILYKTEFGEAIYDNTPTGEFTYMHWTAIGKALLAYFPASRAEEIIEADGLPSATDNTITDRERLFNELEQVRERGYAVEKEEHRDGIVAVAVPIFDTDTDEIVAALSVSGPRQRLTTTDDAYEVKSEIVDAVRNRANVAELRYNHY